MWYEYNKNFMRYKLAGKYIIVLKKLKDKNIWMASIISKDHKVEYITDEEVEVVKILSLMKAKELGWNISKVYKNK